MTRSINNITIDEEATTFVRQAESRELMQANSITVLEVNWMRSIFVKLQKPIYLYGIEF